MLYVLFGYLIDALRMYVVAKQVTWQQKHLKYCCEVNFQVQPSRGSGWWYKAVSTITLCTRDKIMTDDTINHWEINRSRLITAVHLCKYLTTQFHWASPSTTGTLVSEQHCKIFVAKCLEYYLHSNLCVHRKTRDKVTGYGLEGRVLNLGVIEVFLHTTVSIAVPGPVKLFIRQLFEVLRPGKAVVA